MAAQLSINLKHLRDENGILKINTNNYADESPYYHNQIAKHLPRNDVQASYHTLPTYIQPEPDQRRGTSRASKKGKDKKQLPIPPPQPKPTEKKVSNKQLPSMCELYLVLELTVRDGEVQHTHWTPLMRHFDFEEEVVVFPIKYRDLPIYAKIGITIYDVNKPSADSLVASTTVSLFD